MTRARVTVRVTVNARARVRIRLRDRVSVWFRAGVKSRASVSVGLV